MKIEIGTMNCICCGKEIPVEKAPNGTLSFPCGWCKFPGYAPADKKCNGLMLARVSLHTPVEADPPPVKKPAAPPKVAIPPAPAPAPAPPVKTKTTIFG